MRHKDLIGSTATYVCEKQAKRDRSPFSQRLSIRNIPRELILGASSFG
jgi:hypothetical protein